MGVQERDKHAKTVQIYLLCSDGGAMDEPSGVLSISHVCGDTNDSKHAAEAMVLCLVEAVGCLKVESAHTSRLPPSMQEPRLEWPWHMVGLIKSIGLGGRDRTPPHKCTINMES